MAGLDVHPGGGATRVLIVADVRLYREGLSASLANCPHVIITGTSASRHEALARIRELQPDVVVLDMATRESLELVRDVRRDDLPTKILAFAVDEVTSDILECAEAGASGYVTADASVDDLVMAIERIGREELLCSPRIAAKLFGCISGRGDNSVDPSQDRLLTSRETQVLDFIRKGYSNKEIAQSLNIAEPTVKNHVHHLLEKMDVATRAQAAARATLASGRRRAAGG
jgi:DNA-binding NarL/FixJ family response regulator